MAPRYNYGRRANNRLGSGLPGSGQNQLGDTNAADFGQKRINASTGLARDAASFGYTQIDHGADGTPVGGTKNGQYVKFPGGLTPERIAANEAMGIPSERNYASDAAVALDHPTSAEDALTRTAAPVSTATESTSIGNTTTPGQPAAGPSTFGAPDLLGASSFNSQPLTLQNTSGAVPTAFPAKTPANTTGTGTGTGTTTTNAPAATITGKTSSTSLPAFTGTGPNIIAGTAADSADALRTMALANLAKRNAAPDPLGTSTPTVAQGYASSGNFDTARARADLNAGRITADQYGQVVNAASAAGNTQPGLTDAARASLNGSMTPEQQQQLSSEAQASASAAYDRTHPGETASRGYKTGQADSTSQVVGPGGAIVNGQRVAEGSTVVFGPHGASVTPPATVAANPTPTAQPAAAAPVASRAPSDAANRAFPPDPLTLGSTSPTPAPSVAPLDTRPLTLTSTSTPPPVPLGLSDPSPTASTAKVAPTSTTPTPTASAGTRAAQSLMNAKGPAATMGTGVIDATTGAVGNAASNVADFATTLAGGTAATPQERQAAGVDAVNSYVARNPSAAASLNDPSRPASSTPSRMAGGYDLAAMGVPAASASTPAPAPPPPGTSGPTVATTPAKPASTFGASTTFTPMPSAQDVAKASNGGTLPTDSQPTAPASTASQTLASTPGYGADAGTYGSAPASTAPRATTTPGGGFTISSQGFTPQSNATNPPPDPLGTGGTDFSGVGGAGGAANAHSDALAKALNPSGVPGAATNPAKAPDPLGTGGDGTTPTPTAVDPDLLRKLAAAKPTAATAN